MAVAASTSAPAAAAGDRYRLGFGFALAFGPAFATIPMPSVSFCQPHAKNLERATPIDVAGRLGTPEIPALLKAAGPPASGK